MRRIKIKPSKNADTRSCDFANVSKMELLASSRQHIDDVDRAMFFFAQIIKMRGRHHDHTKITNIDLFHKEFSEGFKTLEWLKDHYLKERHHIEVESGVRHDVNLIDVIEHVCDQVMAGIARSGKTRIAPIPNEVLQKALKNTYDLLSSVVDLEE